MSQTEQEEQWRGLIAQSFDPQEWFLRDGEDIEGFRRPRCLCREGKRMWVYRQSDRSLGEDIWSVGYYSPDREWVIDSYWKTKEEASLRVHYLNGGN